MTGTSKISNRLYLSNFASWYRANRAKSSLSIIEYISYYEKSIDKVLPIFEESDFILDTFLSQHYSFQELLILFAKLECSVEELEAFARIALETSNRLADDDSEAEAVLQNIEEIEDALLERLSLRDPLSSYNELHDFLMDKSRVVFCDEMPRLTDLSILCLATVYGTPLVMEILKTWTVTTGSLCDFIAVTRNWEAVKTYPISWAVEVSRAEVVADGE